jgi:hypothetical protein
MMKAHMSGNTFINIHYIKYLLDFSQHWHESRMRIKNELIIHYCDESFVFNAQLCYSSSMTKISCCSMSFSVSCPWLWRPVRFSAYFFGARWWCKMRDDARPFEIVQACAELPVTKQQISDIIWYHMIWYDIIIYGSVTSEIGVAIYRTDLHGLC